MHHSHHQNHHHHHHLHRQQQHHHQVETTLYHLPRPTKHHIDCLDNLLANLEHDYGLDLEQVKLSISRAVGRMTVPSNRIWIYGYIHNQILSCRAVATIMMMMLTMMILPHTIGSSGNSVTTVVSNSVQSMLHLGPFFRFSPVGPLQVVFIRLFRLGFLDAWFAINDVLLMMILVHM